MTGCTPQKGPTARACRPPGASLYHGPPRQTVVAAGRTARGTMAAVPVITIDSGEDDRLAGYRAVSDPALARAGGRFVAEGRRVVERLLLSPAFAVESVLVTPPAHVALQSAPEVLTARPNVPVYLVPQDVMNRVAGFHIHRGCLALARRPVPSAWETLAAG